MGAVSAFTARNYPCTPLMTNDTVTRIKRIKVALKPRPRTHKAYAQIWGHLVSTSKEGHLILTNIYSN